MKEGRKLNKLKIGIVIFVLILIVAITVFGRYIYNTALDAYFSARQFYFSSDVLMLGGNEYTYDNWGGVGQYSITFDLYSFSNKLSRIDYDLNYTVTCESLSTSKIQCSIEGTEGATSTNGIIYAEASAGREANTSTVTILVDPLTTISEGDTVKLKVTAKTEEPYSKEISCTFSLYIKLPDGNTYSIEDKEGREYALLKLVNRSTSATQATLSFNPDILRLDLNDEIYTDPTKLVSIEKDGNGYIKKIVFNIEKECAKNVKFYKVNKRQNYTYPGVADPSPITVDY